jgi:nicotinate-nucleotide adenylyltransferase
VTPKRLGLLGGSFDPVHRGHLALAESARRLLGLDEVWLIPCATSADGKRLAPGRLRLAWLRAALKGLDGLKAWDGELRRGGVSRSIDTLRQLRRALGPEVELFLLLGADQVAQLPAWKEAGRLQAYASLVAFRRAGSRPRAPQGFRVRWLDAPLRSESSTSLRAALAAGKRPKGLPPALARDPRLARVYGAARR